MNWNITAGRPVYVQLIEQLELALVAGEFPPGSRIPPVRELAADAGVTVEQLLADKALRKSIRPERYVDGDVGLPTVTDILEALDKQGLDPREQLQVFAFDPNVHTIDDLRPGMQLPGIVTNITAFGAFVDIGVKHPSPKVEPNLLFTFRPGISSLTPSSSETAAIM